MVDLGSAIGYLDIDTSKFKQGFKDALDDVKKFNDELKGSKEKFKVAADGMTTAGSALTKNVTVPILGVGTGMVLAASKFDKASQSLQISIGATDEKMQSLDEVMKRIYENNYGEGFEDISDALVEVNKQLGDLSEEELQNVTESAFAFRDAFDVEVNESIRTVNTLMKNFGTTSEEAFDLMTWGMQNGLNFSDELIDSINEYGPQFKKLGFSAEEMFQIFQQGAESGAWNLDKVGDAVKELSIRVIDGSETTAAGFEAIGLNADEMAAKFAQGGDSAKEAFYKVVSALGEMEDPLAQNTAGVNLFGTMWEDLGPEVVTQLGNIKDATLDVSGATQQLKDEGYNDLGSMMETLRKNASLLGVEFGEILLPYIIDFVEWLTNMMQRLAEMPESVQQVIVVIGLIVAAVGPLLLLLGNLSKALLSIHQLVGLIGPLISTLGSAFATLTGPIGIAIAAIVGMFIAYQTNLFGIRDLVNSVLSFITSLWEINLFNIQDYFSLFWNSIITILNASIAIFKEIVSVFMAVLTGDWQAAWDGIKNIFSIIWDTIIQLLKNFIESIIIFITNTGPRMLQAARDLFNKAKDGFTEVWNQIIEWFSQVVNDPVGTVLGIGQAMFDAGKNIFNMLWDGMKSIWDSITGWINDSIDWIEDKVKFWKKEAKKVKAAKRAAEDDDDEPDGSHRNGLDYVPYDGYRAELHKGERVLTAEENANYGKGGNTYNFYSPKALTPKEAAREMKRAEREIALGFS